MKIREVGERARALLCSGCASPREGALAELLSELCDALVEHAAPSAEEERTIAILGADAGESLEEAAARVVGAWKACKVLLDQDRAGPIMDALKAAGVPWEPGETVTGCIAKLAKERDAANETTTDTLNALNELRANLSKEAADELTREAQRLGLYDEPEKVCALCKAPAYLDERGDWRHESTNPHGPRGQSDGSEFCEKYGYPIPIEDKPAPAYTSPEHQQSQSAVEYWSRIVQETRDALGMKLGVRGTTAQVAARIVNDRDEWKARAEAAEAAAAEAPARVHAASVAGWNDAIEATRAWFSNETTARPVVRRLTDMSPIAEHVKAAVDAAVEAERRACIEVVEDAELEPGMPARHSFIVAIRARGKAGA